MKELKDYTTEELKAELKRRKIEEGREKLKNRKTEYAYVTATVKHIYKHALFNKKYLVEINKDDLTTSCAYKFNYGVEVSIDKKIKAADRPNVDDTVKLRSRITKDNPTGFGCFAHPKICEVIKRKEE